MLLSNKNSISVCSKPAQCKNCKYAELRTGKSLMSDYYYCTFMNMVCECAKNKCPLNFKIVKS